MTPCFLCNCEHHKKQGCVCLPYIVIGDADMYMLAYLTTFGLDGTNEATFFSAFSGN
jgi:hypothetical protein